MQSTARLGRHDVVAVMTVLLGISWTISAPLEATVRDVALTTALLALCSLAGRAIVGRLDVVTGSPTLTLLGPGLLLGSMAFAGLELLRVEIGLTAKWLSPALLLMIGAWGVHRTAIAGAGASSTGADALAVAGVATLGLGYGRPLLLAAGLAFVGAATIEVVVTTRVPRSAGRALAVIAGIALVALHATSRSRLGVAEVAESFHENLALGVTATDGADRLLDRMLRYHWLGHLVAGGAARSLDLSTLVASGSVVPTIALVGTASTVILTTTRQGERRTLGGISLAIVIVASASSFEQLTFGTDVQSANLLATAWLVVGTYLVLELRQRSPRGLPLLVLVAVSAATAGAKFSHGIVLVMVSSALALGGPRRARAWLVPAAMVVGVGATYVSMIRGSAAGDMVERLPMREATSLFLPLPAIAKSTHVGVLVVLFVLIFALHFVARTPHLLVVISDRATRRVAMALLVGGLIVSSPTVLFAWGEERNLYWVSGAMTSVGVAVGGLATRIASVPDHQTRRLQAAALATGMAILAPLALRVRYDLRDAPVVEDYWNVLTLIVFAWPLVSILGVLVVARRRVRGRGVVLASTAALIGSSFGLYVFVAAGESVVRPVLSVAGTGAEPAERAAVSGMLTAGEWIRGLNPAMDSMLATNLVCDGRSCSHEAYSLGTSSRLPVLYEGALASYRHFDPARLLGDSERKKHLSTDLAVTGDHRTASALVELGVRWYVMRESPDTLTRSEMCADSVPWRCVLTLPDTLVLDLDPGRRD